MDQLQDDLNELAELEPMPRKRGRPKGSGNKSSSKTATRLRVRNFRARKADEAEEALILQERLFKEMRADGLLFFGETAPCSNCVNIAEEVEMAREFGKALGTPDIEPGQNKRAYILSVMQAWCNAGAPLFHRESQTFRRKLDVPDIEQYVWLDGADEPYAPCQPDQPEQEAVCKFLRGKHGIETTDQD